MIYITGSDGQLGSELKNQLGDKAIYLTRAQLDLSNLNVVEEFLKNTKMDLLINAAAYTQVDKAESDQELATLINSRAPKLMSQYSVEKKYKLIHFSTDYVFSGKSFTPYCEDDEVGPINFYGKTKLEGEQGILAENPENLIIRTSWVYSPYGKNFVKTILKLASERSELKVVFDQMGTLTSAEDLAKVTLKARDLNGVFHYSNEGVSSWYDVAFEIKRLKKMNTVILPILSHEYPTPARRPHFGVLNKNKIKSALGLTIPHWTESLELCLKKLS